MQYFQSTLDHQRHKEIRMSQENTNTFIDTDASSTNSRLQFQGGEYEGLSVNKDLNDFAQKSTNVRDRIRGLKNDEILTRGAAIVAVDDLLTREKKTLDAMHIKAMENIDRTIQEANSRLYANKPMEASQAPMVSAIMEAYNSGDPTKRAELIVNPNSAKILSILAKNGLIHDLAVDAINKAHSPEDMQIIEDGVRDARDLSKMVKEFQLLGSLNNNPDEADRVRLTQVL